MPSNVVHYYFSNYVLENLKPEIASVINKNSRAFHVGAQGPDLLFYLRLEKAPLPMLGYDIHDEFVAEKIFAESAEYAAMQASDTLKAFLMGQLCHYALDANLHPYIIQKALDLAQFYKENEKEYMHVLFESALDYICIRDNLKKNSRLYRSHKNLRISSAHRAEIGRYYSEIVAPLMNRKLPQKTAEKSLRLMKLFLWITDDVLGMKYLFLRCVEKVARMPKCLSSFIRPMKEHKGEDWLNHTRAPYPMFHKESVMSEKTVEERTDEARTDAIALINDFYGCLTSGKKPDGALYQRNYSGQRKQI
ncbi:MAG: zinc dependent phospholipase C family protein [Clostridia bacterium]|nr:zinc dependent phospholipase C family protein [Clostridia bacterium]